MSMGCSPSGLRAPRERAGVAGNASRRGKASRAMLALRARAAHPRIDRWGAHLIPSWRAGGRAAAAAAAASVVSVATVTAHCQEGDVSVTAWLEANDWRVTAAQPPSRALKKAPAPGGSSVEVTTAWLEQHGWRVPSSPTELEVATVTGESLLAGLRASVRSEVERIIGAANPTTEGSAVQDFLRLLAQTETLVGMGTCVAAPLRASASS